MASVVSTINKNNSLIKVCYFQLIQPARKSRSLPGRSNENKTNAKLVLNGIVARLHH